MKEEDLKMSIVLKVSRALFACLFSAPILAVAAATASNVVLEEVVVSATLQKRALIDVPTSVTVVDAATLRAAGVQHVEDVLGLIPNLNWAAGTSRPRYYQLRGIGELDQYQGAPNPSVGFLIDDIDFSGLGAPATLFDVEQVEVLRGPQGTTYGANALAGLIKMKTRDPRPEFEFAGEASGAQYSTASAGAVVGGPLGVLGSESAFRMVAQKYRSDGFRQNEFLNRNSTNGFDELSTRVKMHLDFGSNWRVDLLGLYVDQDNGYDAFSIDNSFVTHSDYPGRDAQRSKAIEAKITFDGWSGVKVESISTYSAVDLHYSFDDDWGNDMFWRQFTAASAQPTINYNFYSDFLRRRTTRTQEFRMSSAPQAPAAGQLAWVVGLYALHLNEVTRDLEFGQYNFQGSSFDPGSSSQLISDYPATNKAIYGQLEYSLTAATTLTSGVRYEHRDARYSDNASSSQSASEGMLGGNLSLLHRYAPDHTAYFTISRGYKAGGFNIGQFIPDSLRRFGSEYLWNLEAGERRHWFGGRLATDSTVFYMRRSNMQVSASTQLVPNDPSTFVPITSNAAGDNFGLESTASYRVNGSWQVFGTVGLLGSRYLDYNFVDPGSGAERNLDGRTQAHAPEYRYSVGFDWRNFSGWSARVDLTGVASFYYSVSHDQSSSAYRLVNGRFGYADRAWSVSLWGRNLLNSAYAQRGFYFGNEPPDFPNKLYVQRGDPRQLGMTATWRL